VAAGRARDPDARHLDLVRGRPELRESGVAEASLVLGLAHQREARVDHRGRGRIPVVGVQVRDEHGVDPAHDLGRRLGERDERVLALAP
jgi:hypothetical protein